MPRTIEVQLYQFDELSEKAKEKAREWYRGLHDADNTWSESVYDEAVRFGALMGIEIGRRPVRTMGGAARTEPAIFYSGFWSQGDGACFEGFYSYAKGALAKLKAEASLDTRLHDIAVRLSALQRRYFYGLAATVTHSGRYYHEFCTDIEVDAEGGRAVTEADEAELKDCLREFMRWIYGQLEAAYEADNTDEVVDSNIEANEYEFTEDGERA